MKITRAEGTALILILLIAASVRFWGFSAYSPFFWDEAKYLSEIEGIIPHFGANVGAFAFLKLGHTIFGEPSYPQIVTAFFGLLTVLGCYLLGRRILGGTREGIWLGLLMAGQAALMPYFLKYSRHGLATVFALCFFVYAVYFYLIKLQHPRVGKSKGRLSYLSLSVVAAAMLAMVPACSFKFLLPALMLYVLWEFLIWRDRSARLHDHKSSLNLMISLAVGVVLFLVMPFIAAAISDYSGWLSRAIELSKAHSIRQTMRPAFHFVYPIHLYYLVGPLGIIYAIGGSVFIFAELKTADRPAVALRANLVMIGGFAVNVLFFGLLSHLQSARLFVLTLPFLIYASSLFILRVPRFVPRVGGLVTVVLCLFLGVSIGHISFDYLSKSSNLRPACDVVMERVGRDGVIFTNAGSQVAYNTMNSRHNTGLPYNIKPMVWAGDLALDATNPPLVMLQDGVDLVTVVNQHDKFDRLGELDTLQAILDGMRSITRFVDPVFVAAADFYSTPYYYLEDIYSWRSFRFMQKLMENSRDSVFVYDTRLARSRPVPERP